MVPVHIKLIYSVLLFLPTHDFLIFGLFFRKPEGRFGVLLFGFHVLNSGFRQSGVIIRIRKKYCLVRFHHPQTMIITIVTGPSAPVFFGVREIAGPESGIEQALHPNHFSFPRKGADDFLKDGPVPAQDPVHPPDTAGCG